MPNLGLSMTVLILCQCISQMDEPTRQSYVTLSQWWTLQKGQQQVALRTLPVPSERPLSRSSPEYFWRTSRLLEFRFSLLEALRFCQAAGRAFRRELPDAKAASQLTAPLLRAGDEQDADDEEDGWGFKSSSLPQT
eukprot:CAMPEP_0184646090 /NCGR_PEP_ID=MMETSP0308-20130426/2740_1 /TAXON_ID=38269 /ORGANISM="Gloeochaete witrockiana, Strain SAG 46.84" /LENGTH=135 /DNA_ID=CAMNT_0027075777 /DNA_START=268 /DNA_END=672 /DNA_ORIENTATION=+